MSERLGEGREAMIPEGAATAESSSVEGSRRRYPTPVDPALVQRDIIGSTQPLPIGNRREGLRTTDGARQDQPFVVLRECTFDEWQAWLLARLNPGDELDPQVLVKGRQPGMRFYEISTD